ncbi:MAG: hypothetical protein NUW22_09055 [Acidobacteria bacterium]|nr:hypothetical protein [Acidobacteriota bacterium]
MVTALARRRTWMAGLPFLSVAVAIPVLLAAAPAMQMPHLPDLLRLAADYHADYVTRVSGASLDEQYQLIDVTGGRMQAVTRISSDVVFVNLNGGVTALRDAYAVDTKPLRPRAARITTLLAAPATPSVKDWETVIRFPAESSVYFALDIILKVNEPTTALRFIAASAQPSLKYKLQGQKKINGIQTVGLNFDEPAAQDKKYLLGTRSNARASGRLWIDPATGAVHRTELWVDSKGESANITVKYAPHPALGLLLPSETNEQYDEREAASGPRDDSRGVPSGSAGSRISFQAQARYSKPAHAPIDLRNLKK